MFALSLDQAKLLALGLVVIFVALAAVSAWVMKELTKKLLLATVALLLAVLVWTQRAALTECADNVRTAGFRGETTCTFLGQDVDINSPASRSAP